MKRSLYVYNNGDLKRKDNTLQFTSYEGEKRDIPMISSGIQGSLS